MIRVTRHTRLQYRTTDNLPSKVGYGRTTTGYITPYRHWMWKQNELWRNVHEAQFEHLRNLYKRQWFESYRVNADEYIHKYNITKAAQLNQWENEMHAQDARRRETRLDFISRKKLKAKHRDLLRESHEREFFRWYERASERLQSMKRIPFIPRDNINAHIEKELNKYVAGRSGPYPLNFVGQMPVLEDTDGNIAEVPDVLHANFVAERPTTTAKEYVAPGIASASTKLAGVVSGDAHALFDESGGAAPADAIHSAVLDDMAREEEALREQIAVDERSDEESEVSRRAYINRGKLGAKHRSEWKSSGRVTTITPEQAPAAAPAEGGAPAAGRKKRPARSGGVSGGRAARQQIIDDAVHRRQDTKASDNFLHSNLERSDEPQPDIGEVVTRVPKLRSRLKMPDVQDVSKNPLMAAQAGGKSLREVMSATSKDRDE